MAHTDRYLAYMGMAPERIPHWEALYCPDAETHITGIDYYEHPKLCREKLQELYPQVNVEIPEKDDPMPRPVLGEDGKTSRTDENGRRYVRWGAGETGHWNWGQGFDSAEDVFAFSPLESADFSDSHIFESRDYSDEDTLYEMYRARFPAEWGDQAPDGSTELVGFYNTMFMWPQQVFGWELFLETCLDPRFERIMNEFAEINRRVFMVFARMPVHFVICHDDIVTTRGPVCSPAWMSKYLFPRYEEFWSMLKDSGKRIIFMGDGCLDACVDDLFACGANGIISEPHTNFKAIARKHENCVLAGEGDNRILTRNNPAEIESMVRSMVETAHMTCGYLMGIGNQIPWNVPPAAVKHYLDCAAEIARR